MAAAQRRTTSLRQKSVQSFGEIADPAPLTREELAQTIGTSKSTIRRMEARGELKAAVNERGVHLFPITNAEVRELIGSKPIRRLMQARSRVPSSSNADGELGAQVFDRLENNVHPVDIVRELRLHPDVVDGFVIRWSRWRKAVVLTSQQTLRLAKAARTALPTTRDDGAAPFVQGVLDALEFYRDSAQRPCSKCGEGRRTHCSTCAVHPVIAR